MVSVSKYLKDPALSIGLIVNHVFSLQVISKDGGTAAVSPAVASSAPKAKRSPSSAVNGDKAALALESAGDTTEEESSLSVQLRCG